MGPAPRKQLALIYVPGRFHLVELAWSGKSCPPPGLTQRAALLSPLLPPPSEPPGCFLYDFSLAESSSWNSNYSFVGFLFIHETQADSVRKKPPADAHVSSAWPHPGAGGMRVGQLWPDLGLKHCPQS